MTSCLAAILVASLIVAFTNILAARTLGAILIEYRHGATLTHSVREAFLIVEKRQMEVMEMTAAENRRLSALICEHLMKLGKMDKPCVAP